MAPRVTGTLIVIAGCLAAVPPGSPQAVQGQALESRQLQRTSVLGGRLTSELHLERLGAVRALLDESLWDEGKPLLLQGMSDKDPVVRMVSAFGLGNIRSDAAFVREALAAGLRDEDAHVRRFSALALGSMGRSAAGTEPALKALAADPDPGVQTSAAWAAQRVAAGAEPMETPKIVRRGGTVRPETAVQPAARPGTSAGRASTTGLAAGTSLPPGAGTGRGAKAKPAEDPPGGRVYFLADVQEADESGITETKVRALSNSYTYAHLFNAVTLQYIDVKEARLYRQDAARRGLKTDVPLFDLLRADPQGRVGGLAATDTPRYDTRRFNRRYQNDHVIAISCNGQTRFQYRRFDSDGKRHDWGGLYHLGMTPGRYGVEVRIFTADGFRLDFKFDVDVDLKSERTISEVSALNALRGPQDVRPELRRRIATPNPKRQRDNELRARDAKQLAYDLAKTADRLLSHAGWMAGDLLPFLQDAAALMRRARRLDPSVPLQDSMEDAANLVISRGWWLNTPAAYAVSLDAFRLLESGLAGVPYNSPDDPDRWEWGILSGSGLTLGGFAISYRNDIPLFWRHQEERLRHVNIVWRPKIMGDGKLPPTDFVKERDSWPQPGWWRSEWDDVLPPAIEEEAAAAVPAGPAAEAESIGSVEDIFSLMQETLDEIDEVRAKDQRWLREMFALLKTAEQKKIDVRSTLRVLALEARQRAEHVKRLRANLAEIPDDDGVTYLEDIFKWGIETWDELTSGEQPKTHKDLRRKLQMAIAKANQEREAMLRQQDQLVQDALDGYGRIIGEMERIGEKSQWKEVREASARAKRDVSDILTLSKAELYLASEQDARFRAAAREAWELGRYEPKVRWMEASYFMSRKDYAHALYLFRQIAGLTKPEGPEAPEQPGRMTVQPAPQGTVLESVLDRTSEFGWLHDRCRKMVWSLEHNYLAAIDAKATGEAANVRAMLDERLKKGGEDGWWEYVKSTVKLGVVSIYSQFSGREKALENLATGFQTDVAAQHCGLLLIRSLHERGVPLDEIEGLSNDRFIALMREKYDGRTLAADDALRMRVAIKAAFGNPDMKRLASQSKQMLDVDTGREHIETDLYQEQAVEWWGDIANVWNILTVLGPNATFSIGGKVQWFQGWRWGFGPKPTGPVVTAKEAFMKAAGLQKLGEGIVRSLTQTGFGQAQMNNLAKFLANASGVGARGLDLALSKWSSWIGEAAGGTMGVIRGGDGKAEAEAGKMLAELINAWGVGDVDVMKNIMKNYGIQPEHLRELLEAAQSAARTSEQASVHLSTHVKALQQALPEAASPQGLSAAGRANVRASMEQVERRLQAIAGEFQAGRATPELCREVDGLQAAYEGLSGVDSGMLRQAGAWQEALDSASRRAQQEAVAASAEAARLKSLSGSLSGADPNKTLPQGAVKQLPVELPAGSGAPLFPPTRGARFTRDLDKLFDDGRIGEAMDGYQRRLALVRQFTPGNTGLIGELEAQIARARTAKAARFRLATLPEQANAMDHLQDVLPAHFRAWEANPNIVLERVAKEGTATFSDPYWVMEKRGNDLVKIGLFKRSKGTFEGEYDIRGEVLYARMAKLAGVEVPACAIGEMAMPGVGKVRGVFIRMAPGDAVSAHGVGAAVAFKKEIARDLVLSLLLGDHDRRLDNFLASKRLVSIDHAMADPAGKVWPAGPDVTDIQIEELWKQRLFQGVRWSNNGLKGVDEALSAEAMQDTIRRLKPVVENPDLLGEYVNSVYEGEDAAAAMKVLPRRLKVLEGFIEHNFGRGLGSVPSAPGSSARVLPFSAPSRGRAASGTSADGTERAA